VPSSGSYKTKEQKHNITQHISHAPTGRDPFGSNKNEADVCMHIPKGMSTTMNLHFDLLIKIKF